MKHFALSFICILISIQISCNSTGNNAKHGNVKINDQGVNIAYTDNGLGDTTLLFVHGWCINKSYWENQVKYFSEKYRVITVDLPGFGKSGKNRNDWTTEAFGRDIDSVMSQLKLKNVILIGHSMAGDIILQAAINNTKRVIGLIGVDNFKNFGHVQTKKDKVDYGKAVDSLRHNFKHIAFEYFNQSLFYKTTADSIKKRVLNDVAKADTAIAANCMEQGSFDEIKQLSALNKKLYLINSDITPTDTSGFRQNHIHYQVFNIHATGHFPMIENPEEFNFLLKQIIARI